MTDADWEVCDDPAAMLRSVRERASPRQYRLFAVACARDELARAQAGQGCFNFGCNVCEDYPHKSAMYWDPERGYEAAIRAAEDMADGVTGGATPRPYAIWIVAQGAPYGNEEALIAYAALGYDPDDLVSVPPDAIDATIRRYSVHPTRYLRDIFGHPFRRVAFDPAWRTETVVTLTTGIYRERAFDRMPVLADALEEAGCDTPEILAHCREPGVHARGCWVVDLISGDGRWGDSRRPGHPAACFRGWSG